MKIVFLLFFVLSLSFSGLGQDGGIRKRTFKVIDSIRLDTLSIYPHSFQVHLGDSILDSEFYTLNFSTAVFKLNKPIEDTLFFSYQVLPLDFSKHYELRDSSILFNKQKDNYALFKIQNYYSVDDVFGGNELNKNGSISRGVSFGNNQDLGINSSLNLELSGKISSDLKILASVSDANIPIQPEGNTNKLQRV